MSLRTKRRWSSYATRSLPHEVADESPGFVGPRLLGLHNAFRSARVHKAGFNNWLLFAATVEAFLFVAGKPDWDVMRIDYALRQHEQWYLGDGLYGDSPEFHLDDYNSFVIQPMLVDVLAAVRGIDPDWDVLETPIFERAQRYAAIQERLISTGSLYLCASGLLALGFAAR